jgi:hypothetical protein
MKIYPMTAWQSIMGQMLCRRSGASTAQEEGSEDQLQLSVGQLCEHHFQATLCALWQDGAKFRQDP